MLGGTIRFVRHRPNDVDDDLPGDHSADGAEPAIKFRGKRIDQEDQSQTENTTESAATEPVVKTPAAANANEALPETENLDVADESVPAKPGLGARLASALRIRNLGKNDEHNSLLHELEAANQREEEIEYELPPLDMLLPSETVHLEEHEKEVRQKAKMLEQTFASFGFKVRVVEIETGPVIAQYEVELEAGLRLSKITSLADDLAIALRVPSVRIVAPIPGKNTVGIEVPNNDRQLVRLREVIEETNGRVKKMRIPIYLGKDVAGNPMAVDLGDAAPLAHCRAHRHRQKRVLKHDYHFDFNDPQSARCPHADDRPQDGRAQSLQAVAAFDASGGYRYEKGRSHFGLGRGKNGGALCACWLAQACAISAFTTN